MNLLLAILKRIVSALVGFFLLFDIYFLIRTLMKGVSAFQTVTAHDFWYRAYIFLTLPFSDTQFDVLMLSKLYAAPAYVHTDPQIQGYIKGLWILLTEHILLFLVVIACIVLFELRKQKTNREAIAFYLLIPSTIWLVWLLVTTFLT
jgi:hypothetical protein